MDLRLARALYRKRVMKFIKYAVIIALVVAALSGYIMNFLEFKPGLSGLVAVILGALTFSGVMVLYENLTHNIIFRD